METRPIRGQYKTKNRSLTEKFRQHTHNKDVEIYYDRGLKRYLLYYKGRFNMELSRGINSEDYSRARTHFTRLGGSIRYSDKEKEIDQMEENEKIEEEKLLKDIVDDFKSDIHYIRQSPTSIVIGG